MRKLKNSELRRLTVEEFKRKGKIPVIILLDNVRSLNNIGSVFRTADAFLVESIYLCGYTARPPHRDIHKTALGATESVDWRYVENITDAILELREAGYSVIAIEQAESSVPLDQFQAEADAKLAVIFGNEVAGVQQAAMDLVDACIEIPQFGTKHSLNISVSAGIVAWELFQRLSK